MSVDVRSLNGDGSGLGDDVLDGLTRPFKELPPKHFYDQAGAELFDRICELPEYYPTRAERAILAARSGDIAALTGAAEVVELGSGTAEKSRLLLSALADAGTLRRYVPVDVTEGMIRATGAALAAEYPGLEVQGIVGDFERHLGHLPAPAGPRIIALLGGTIGNFTPGSRRRFLRGIGRLLAPDGALLLGFDLVKDPARIEAAYDDRAGVTAAFNRNVLRVVNRELNADFEPERFDHVAFFDREHEWIEMRLRAQQRMTVRVADLGLTVEFAKREELRTEISAKFTPRRLAADLAAARLTPVELFTDPDGLFGLTLARPQAAPHLRHARHRALAAGAALVAFGGVAAIWSRRSGPPLATQALGMGVLGVLGVVVAGEGSTAGSDFHSALRPALGLDRLSAIFVAALALVAVPALVYAGGYLAASRHRRAIAALTSGFLLAMLLVVLARDVTTLLAGWELMTLIPAAAILVVRGTEADVRRAVFVYLAVTHVGGAGTWAALLTLAHHGAIGGAADGASTLSPGVSAFVAVAAIVGFGTKAGLMPLHSWLPRAHPVAPSHVSALMSGMMIKVALYGLIRVLFEWLGPLPLWVGLLVLAMGLLSAVGGVLHALVQQDLKRLLAFSSIENVGIIALGLGAALVFRNRGSEPWAALALGAALLHTINHAAFKALLFLGAGAFERATGSLALDQLGGLLRRMPWTGATFLVGCVAIAGVPPLNGFVSEWLMLQALVHLTFDQPVGIALAGALAVAGLAATAALAVYCFVKVIGLVLLGPARTSATEEADECGTPMRAGMVALALACAGLAAVPGVLLPALAGAVGDEVALPVRAGLAVPGSGGLPTLAVIATFAGLVALVGLARGSRRAAQAPVWACGQRLAPALNWTSAGFTKPLRLVLESVLRPEREITRTEVGGVLRRVEYRGTVPHLFDTLLYGPAERAALRGAAVARRLQSGSVRTYAGYLLGLLVIALLLAHWGVLT